MDLLTILNGTFSIIYVSISIIIAIHMILTYFKIGEKLLIFVGITWIGIVTPWLPSSISFIVALFNEVGIPRELYFIIGNIAAPAIIIIWMLAFTEFFYKDKKTILLTLAVVYGAVFEFVFLYILISDPVSIANFRPPIDVDYQGIFMIIAATIILYMLITGIIFSYNSIISYDRETKVKGYFLLVAFISYAVGAFLDAAISAGIVLLIITRLVLISSAIEWYFGFMLPGFLKKKFVEE
jgi:hypothetical protein